MFSARHMAVAAALAGATIAIVAPDAARAGTVVKSSGPSAAEYPVGKKLKDTDRITLKEGDSITVLTAQGTRVISGAGTHVVGARGAASSAKFALLTRQKSARRVRTGAVRGGEGAATNPSIWNVDVTQSGTFCLADASIVRLWRPDKEGVATYSIAKPTGTTVNVLFDDGDADAPWDTNQMPLAADTEFTIRGPGGVPETRVNFAMIDFDADNSDAETLAETFIENGCMAQLELLSSSLAG